MAGLIDKSLLSHAETSGAGRPLYQMFEPCGAARCASSRQQVSAMRPLKGSCVTARLEASRAESGLAGRAQVEWLNRVHDDLDSYRGA